jgi:sugar-specific transcriptional regulator TrmB
LASPTESLAYRGYDAQLRGTVRLLNDGSARGASEVADVLGFSTSRARDILNELVRREWATFERTRPRMYRSLIVEAVE